MFGRKRVPAYRSLTYRRAAGSPTANASCVTRSVLFALFPKRSLSSHIASASIGFARDAARKEVRSWERSAGFGRRPDVLTSAFQTVLATNPTPIMSSALTLIRVQWHTLIQVAFARPQRTFTLPPRLSNKSIGPGRHRFGGLSLAIRRTAYASRVSVSTCIRVHTDNITRVHGLKIRACHDTRVRV